MSRQPELELHAASDPIRANVVTADIKKEDLALHVEDAEADIKRQERDIVYDAQEDLSKRTGLRKLLKRNPSYEFIRQVAMKNEEVLDPKQVRRVCLSSSFHSSFFTTSLFIFSFFFAPVVFACNRRVGEHDELTDQLEKKIFWWIVPALCIDYIFYYVDKTTLSYAALFGIREDLKLVGTQYSTLSSIFYVGWMIWALPGTYRADPERIRAPKTMSQTSKMPQNASECPCSSTPVSRCISVRESENSRLTTQGIC